MFKFSPELLAIIYACQSEFAKVIDTFGHENAYAFRCVQCEYSMRYSEEFLIDAAKNARSIQDTFWIEYFEKHLVEESGHHAWALSDLTLVSKVLGKLPEISTHIIELMTFQSEKLKTGDFLSQFGYCLAVECFQGSQEYWVDFQSNCNLPKNAFTNCMNHSIIDISHRDEIINIYSDLDDPQKRIVDESSKYTALQQLRSVRHYLANK